MMIPGLDCQIWFNVHWTGYRFTEDLLTSNNHVYMGLGTMHHCVSGHLRRMIHDISTISPWFSMLYLQFCAYLQVINLLHTFHFDKIEIVMNFIHVLHFYTNFVPIFLRKNGPSHGPWAIRRWTHRLRVGLAAAFPEGPWIQSPATVDLRMLGAIQRVKTGEDVNLMKNIMKHIMKNSIQQHPIVFNIIS